MSIPAITMEKAKALIETLPSLASWPPDASIRALEQDLITKLENIPSHQSMGTWLHLGMVMQPVLYVRKRNTALTDFSDPGLHRTIDPLMNAAGQNDLLED